MSAWRPALRIARRTVLRSPARSLLVALLVAIPVAGATVVDVVVRTFNAPDQDAQQQIGSADATISAPENARTRVREMLPAGSRTVDKPHVNDIAVRRGEGRVNVELVIADAGEPLHRYEAELVSGALPDRTDEVLVSKSLADKLGVLGDGDEVRPQAAITLADGQRVTVTGLVRQQFCLSCERLVAAPGPSVARAAAERDGEFNEGGSELLADLPEGTSAASLDRRFDARGFELSTRRSFILPSGVELDASSATLRAAALVAIIVGLGLLEVVLLAGTAFAVGARRQMREIGLAAANGASERDVKRIVLAQGLVLGALGAAIGVAIGATLAFAARPLWEHLMDEAVVTWRYGPWEIFAAALVGLFSGLAAAIVPARGASRMRPVDALAQRFRPVGSVTRRTTLIGSVLVGAGAFAGLLGDRLLADDFATYERALGAVATGGASVGTPSSEDAITLIVLGGTLAVVGLVLLTPALIGLLARLGPRLPLSGRLAARDAARHRHRTGPAIAAITVAVAGSIVLAFVVAGVSRGEEQRYVERLPAGVLAVERFNGGGEALRTVADRAAAQLPGGRADAVRSLTARGEALALLARGKDVCPKRLRRRGECAAGAPSIELAVATSGGLAKTVSDGRFDASARAALEQGKVLVFSPKMLDRAGEVLIAGRDGDTRLPGHLVDRGPAYTALPAALVAPAVARAQGWGTTTETVLVRFRAGTDQAAVDRALDQADGDATTAYVERGPSTLDHSGILLVVALISALVTLFGVALSVALSAAEGRADLATLAAVGAPPHRRRTLVAGQALVVGGLGCAMGLALGTFVSFTARSTFGATSFVVPWSNVLATGIAVPLLAALVAALCTRSRLPMVRRAE
ncbi:MAG: FtsX-like permease family protein [Actinomycetota bacterium]|nr:FtsX-like permease family protein [Actinomycetota bacterium]